MTFLALDTSGEYCVLALSDDGGTVQAVSIFEGKRTLSRRLLGEVDSLLTRNSLTLPDLSAFAVGVGPGSFTGVRVGVTTAKTLAQVTGKPLVGIGTLDAYAAAWSSQSTGETIAAVLPSRKGEVYASLTQNGQCLEEPFAAPIEELTQRLRAMPKALVCGDTSQLPGWTGLKFTQLWTPPDGLALLAAQRLAAGDTDEVFGLVPLYVVAPSISTPKKAPISVGTGT